MTDPSQLCYTMPRRVNSKMDHSLASGDLLHATCHANGTSISVYRLSML